MRKILIGAVTACVLAGTIPAVAQEGEIIVTAMRKLVRDDDEDRVVERPVLTPAAVQMLRRTADFAVQQVVVVSDTVEEADAHKEVQAMTRKAIDLAGASGVQLASGELVVEPLTPGNYKELRIEEIDEGEIDGQAVKFLVKVPLAPGIDAKTALAKIDKFIKAVPAVGRAEIKAYSELTLSVVEGCSRAAVLTSIFFSSFFSSGFGASGCCSGAASTA